jgi:hypothetical protein
LSFELPSELRARLDAVSAPEKPFPYYMFADIQQTRIHGGVAVGDKPKGYAAPVFVPQVEMQEIRAR